MLAFAAHVPARVFAFVPAYAFGVFGFEGPVDGFSALLGLFGHVFVHTDRIHLLTNLAALALFGGAVEALLGGRRFLLLFFAAAAIAALVEGMVGDDRLRPLVGASGGISGVMGAFAVALPRARLALPLPFGWNASLSLLWLILGELTANLLLAILPGAEFAAIRAAVAWGAHVGGFIAGALLVWWLRPAKGQPWPAIGQPQPLLRLTFGWRAGYPGNNALVLVIWMLITVVMWPA